MTQGVLNVTRGLVGWIVAALLIFTATGVESAGELGIITGGEKGTYYQFGLDLQRLVKQSGIDLSVYPSKGSIDNVYAVYQRPATQMGIVQSDVLAFVARVQSDPVLKRIAKKTKLVFPLYNEEVHLLGRRGIADFDDLADRRVAIGREGSGTYLTARLLFKVSEVSPKEMVPIDTDQALAELKAGRIDAMFYVAGVPGEALRGWRVRGRWAGAHPDHQQEHHRVLPACRDPGGHVRRAAEPAAHRGGEGDPDLLRFPQARLRTVGQFAQTISDQPLVARQERASEVEVGRSRRAPQGMGAIRLRQQGSWQEGPPLDRREARG